MGGRQPNSVNSAESSQNITESSATQVVEPAEKLGQGFTPQGVKDEEKVRTQAPLWRAFDAYADDPRCEDIAVTDAVTGVFSPRLERDEKHIEALAESLRSEGQHRAIIVTPRKGKLAVVSGDSRVLAARKAGLTKLRGINVVLTDEQSLAIALAANLDHALPHMKLTELEEAKRLEILTKNYAWTQEKAGDYLGKVQQWVSRRLALLKVEKPVADHIEKGELTSTHARPLTGLPPETQVKVADKAAADKLSVKDTEKLSKAVKDLPPSKVDDKKMSEILAKKPEEIGSKSVEAVKAAPVKVTKPANPQTEESGPVPVSVQDGLILFCCPGCKARIAVDPKRQVAALDEEH